MEFEQQHVNITDEYKSMYDEAAAVWLQLREAIGRCKEELGIIDPALHKVSYHLRRQQSESECVFEHVRLAQIRNKRSARRIWKAKIHL